jgi:hypothetical protein
VEKIIKKIIEKVLRTRSNRKIKKDRISLPYNKKMEDKRKKNLKYKIKPKVVRCLSMKCHLKLSTDNIFNDKYVVCICK